MYVGCSDLQHSLCDPSRSQRSLIVGGRAALNGEGRKKEGVRGTYCAVCVQCVTVLWCRTNNFTLMLLRFSSKTIYLLSSRNSSKVYPTFLFVCIPLLFFFQWPYGHFGFELKHRALWCKQASSAYVLCYSS